MSRAAKCKHRRVAADKRCKDCGQPVDLTAKRSKYGNRKVEIEGIWFDSEREGKRYLELKALVAAEKIFKLETQVTFDLEVNGILICRYRADFVYRVIDSQKGQFIITRKIVEDSKGHKTKDYMLKRKLMKACHGIEILET